MIYRETPQRNAKKRKAEIPFKSILFICFVNLQRDTMMFNEMGMCGNMDFFSPASLGEVDFCPAPAHPEPDSVVEDDYTDDEIDVDELERRMWRDKMRLKRLKEQDKSGSKEGVDAAKQRQSQEQARRKKMSRAQDGILKYMLKMMEVCKAQGFVYGIIPENGKPVTGASDNLREWWKDKVRFDRNGPAAISKYQAENNIPGYDVDGLEKETHYEVEELKPEKVNFGMAANFPVKEEVPSEFMRKRKPSRELNTMMDRTIFTCENTGCAHGDVSRGFLDRNSRDNHQFVCPHRDSGLPYGAPSRFHVSEVKPVVGFSQPRPVNSVSQPIDLTGIGVPEDGQKMISELMSMYDRNVQSNQNQTSMVMETQLLQPTVQNHQEHLQFQGSMVEGSFFEDLNIPNRVNNQMFFQGNNNNSGFKYDTAHTNNNNNFEAAHNNGSSNRFQLVFDSPPFDMASFDYRDDMSMPGVVGTMDGMQQKQQDVSIWF
ncbi:hypothetical protein IGI04_019888 [Brassica rapa subsp. trilocularis]|uniref:Ethylene insensitive 3-like DNA-binding domain-containing protein n=1 Tax=Brassica rapa subsp. trilocularis TaxID=1813537 RepID=A0ABQ7MH62_BRACM|nr:hypothetical protein IGI04_019888 [Brassica rapa subsp. trilocularis]